MRSDILNFCVRPVDYCDTTTLLVIGSTIVGFLMIYFTCDMLLLLTPESLLKRRERYGHLLCFSWVFSVACFRHFWTGGKRCCPCQQPHVSMQYLSTRYYGAIPDKVFTLLIIAIVVVVLFHAIGKWNAENQRSFAVLPDQSGSFATLYHFHGSQFPYISPYKPTCDKSCCKKPVRIVTQTPSP
jgi:hypothetical protein